VSQPVAYLADCLDAGLGRMPVEGRESSSDGQVSVPLRYRFQYPATSKGAIAVCLGRCDRSNDMEKAIADLKYRDSSS